MSGQNAFISTYKGIRVPFFTGGMKVELGTFSDPKKARCLLCIPDFHLK
jgi:hypothetical protein